jgi:hypothetical protein
MRHKSFTLNVTWILVVTILILLSPQSSGQKSWSFLEVTKSLNATIVMRLPKSGRTLYSNCKLRVQEYYIQIGPFLGQNVSLQNFIERLNELNRYLLYFPEENPKQLDQDEIIEILDQAKAPEWHAPMVAANIDIFSMT